MIITKFADKILLYETTPSSKRIIFEDETLTLDEIIMDAIERTKDSESTYCELYYKVKDYEFNSGVVVDFLRIRHDNGMGIQVDIYIEPIM